jgi:hypothetical protein
MASTKDLTINLQLQNQQLLDALKKTNKSFTDTEKKQSKLSKGINKIRLGYIAVAGVLGGVVVKTLGTFIKRASDAEEITSKFNVVFSKLGKEATRAAKNLADGFGLTNIQAQKLLGNTGDLLTGFGFTQEAALDLSTKIASLGADLASFTNLEGGAEEASKRLTSALTGETEGLKALGIVVRQDTKQFQDRVKAIQESEGVTLQQAKSLAILEQATTQSKNAIGDFQRTQAGTANQIRIFKNNVEDLIISVGQRLLPAFNSVLQFFNKLIGSTDRGAVAIKQYQQANNDLVRANFELEKAIASGNKEAIEQAKIFKDKAVGDRALALLELKSAQRENNKEIEDNTKVLKENQSQRVSINKQIKSQRAELDKFNKIAESGDKAIIKSTQNRYDAYGRVIGQFESILKGAKAVQFAENRQVEISSELASLQAKVNEQNEMAAEVEAQKNTQKQIALVLDAENQQAQALALEEDLKRGEERTDAEIANKQKLDQTDEEILQNQLNRNSILDNKQMEFANKQIARTQVVGDITNQTVKHSFDLAESLIRRNVKNEEEANEKIKRVRRAAAVAAKLDAIFRIGIDTATSIIRFLADPGGYPGIGLSIGAAVQGTAALAAVAAKPIPKFQDGGIIRNVAPANVPGEDGIIAAQRGEAVLTRDAVTELGESTIDALNSGQGIQPSITINVANGEGAVDTLNDYFRQFGGGRELTTG